MREEGPDYGVGRGSPGRGSPRAVLRSVGRSRKTALPANFARKRTALREDANRAGIGGACRLGDFASPPNLPALSLVLLATPCWLTARSGGRVRERAVLSS